MVQNCGEGIQDEEDEVITCSGKNDAVEKEMPLHYDQNEVIISSFKFFIYMFVFYFHRYMYMHRKGIILSKSFILRRAFKIMRNKQSLFDRKEVSDSRKHPP